MTDTADSDWTLRHAQMKITSPSPNRLRCHIKQPAAPLPPLPPPRGFREQTSADRSHFFCNTSQVFTEKLQPEETESILRKEYFLVHYTEKTEMYFIFFCNHTADRLFVLRLWSIHTVNCGEKHHKHLRASSSLFIEHCCGCCLTLYQPAAAARTDPSCPL